MKKMFLILVFTIFLVGSFYSPAFGVDQAVTMGIEVLPYMVAGEYEFKITDSSTICIRTGTTLFFGVLTGAGVGYRWYYSNEVLDGFYFGGYVDYFTFQGVNWFYPDSYFFNSYITYQGVLGYKKVLGDRFVFDLGLSANLGESARVFNVVPGVIATMGVVW